MLSKRATSGTFVLSRMSTFRNEMEETECEKLLGSILIIVCPLVRYVPLIKRIFYLIHRD